MFNTTIRATVSYLKEQEHVEVSYCHYICSESAHIPYMGCGSGIEGKNRNLLPSYQKLIIREKQMTV